MRIMEAVANKPNLDSEIWKKERFDVGEPMVDYIFRELEWKVSEYTKTGVVTAFDPRSPEEEKDCHRGAEMKVVGLAYSSLFPLVYDRNRVLRDKVIGVDNCFSSIGQSTAMYDVRSTQHSRISWRGLGRLNKCSERFRWLPCNDEIGPNGECWIASYINNLHPAMRNDLYREYPSDEEPEPEDEDGDDYDDRYEERSNRRQPERPEPCPYQPRQTNLHEFSRPSGSVSSQGQVIVKLANIELTPDKPKCEGRAWRIEGQPNERICATAINYYGFENNTENTLSFRHRADAYYYQAVKYGQGEFQFLRAFGFEPDLGNNDYEPITQYLGWVLCRIGRLLSFANTLQHRPGYCKILAFFLRDPSRRITSTANAPPQTGDWWIECVVATHYKYDFTPMTMDEAKAYRLELMDERSEASESENELFTRGGFALCEH
ncbi:hypothetical protein BDW68DRAFT_192152 [Aspergillus falconensis]